jgi:hypothetical protein
MKLEELLKLNFVMMIEDNKYKCLKCNKIYTKLGVINHHFYEHEEDGIKKKQELREKTLKKNNSPDMKQKISDRTKEAFKRKDVRKNFQNYVERMKDERTGEGNPMYGKHHTDEWKENHSNIMTGFKHTDEAKQKLRIVNTGKKHSVESINKMRIAKLGKKASPETKMKMRKVHRKNKYSQLTIKKIKDKYPLFQK